MEKIEKIENAKAFIAQNNAEIVDVKTPIAVKLTLVCINGMIGHLVKLAEQNVAKAG